MTKSGNSKETTSGTAVSTSWAHFLAFMSGLLYAVCSVLAKYISNIHPAQLVIYQYWALLSFSLPQFVFSQESIRCHSVNYFMLLALGISNATAAVLYFVAYRYLPAGEAATLIGCYPAFVVVTAKIFLKESFGLVEVVSLLTTIVGLVFVSGSNGVLFGNSRVYTTTDIYGIATALSSVVTICTARLLLRKMKNVNPSSILFISGIVGIIEASVVTTLLDSFRMHYKGLQQLLIIFLGFSGWLGLMASTLATQHTNAGLAATMTSASGIFFPFVFQVIMFHDIPEGLSIFGAILVVFSIVLVGFRSRISAFLPARCTNFC